MATHHVEFVGIDPEKLLTGAAAVATFCIAVDVVIDLIQRSSDTDRCHHSADGEHLPPAVVRALERGEEVTIPRFRGRDLTIRGADPLDDAEEIEVESVREEDDEADDSDDADDLEGVEHQSSDGIDVGAEGDTDA